MAYQFTQTGAEMQDILNLAQLQIAAPYDSASSYTAGDYCTKDDGFYVCTASTSGTWDASKWSAVTVGDVLETANANISSLNATLTNKVNRGAYLTDVVVNKGANSDTHYIRDIVSSTDWTQLEFSQGTGNVSVVRTQDGGGTYSVLDKLSSRVKFDESHFTSAIWYLNISTGYPYLRWVRNGKNYQLVITATGIKYETNESGSWVTVWSK